MIISFFHDHNFMVYCDKVYTTGTLASNVWNRYLLDKADKLIVCARQIPFDKEQRGALSSSKDVSFYFSEDLSSINGLLSSNKHNVIKGVIKKSDLIIARLPSEIGLAACNEALRQNKPFICEVVGCPYDALSGYGSLKARIYAPLLMLRMKKAVRKANGAIYVTEYMLQKKYPNISMTTNVSNVQISNVLTDEIVAKRIQRFNQRKRSKQLKIGLIGSVKNKIKGVDLAINATSGLASNLHVIGSGDPSCFSSLARNKGCNFVFDGFFSEPDHVLEWLDDIDIYIQPSLQEGLPRATIEAMSRGCPVLSSNAGGLPELVLDEYVHKMGNVGQLKSHLDDFISCTDDQLESSIRHSLKTASNYLVETLTNRRTAFLHEVINKCVLTK